MRASRAGPSATERCVPPPPPGGAPHRHGGDEGHWASYFPGGVCVAHSLTARATVVARHVCAIWRRASPCKEGQQAAPAQRRERHFRLPPGQAIPLTDQTLRKRPFRRVPFLFLTMPHKQVPRGRPAVWHRLELRHAPASGVRLWGCCLLPARALSVGLDRRIAAHAPARTHPAAPVSFTLPPHSSAPLPASPASVGNPVTHSVRGTPLQSPQNPSTPTAHTHEEREVSPSQPHTRGCSRGFAQVSHSRARRGRPVHQRGRLGRHNPAEHPVPCCGANHEGPRATAGTLAFPAIAYKLLGPIRTSHLKFQLANQNTNISERRLYSAS